MAGKTLWQRWAVDLPAGTSPEERQNIGQAIIDTIRYRTQRQHIDKNGKAFAPYSKAYIKSINFKIAGKSKGSKPDLTSSGDTLGALSVLKDSPQKILIGYENGSQENAIADGNIRGTYGQSKPIGPGRDFLGLPKSVLDKIVQKYTAGSQLQRQAQDIVTQDINKAIEGMRGERFPIQTEIGEV